MVSDSCPARSLSDSALIAAQAHTRRLYLVQRGNRDKRLYTVDVCRAPVSNIMIIVKWLSGIKRKHDTNLYSNYFLNEIIDLYRILNCSVLVCFLGASKGFALIVDIEALPKPRYHSRAYLLLIV